MDKIKLAAAASSSTKLTPSPLPVNGSIRLPNGKSIRYVRSDIMRDVIDRVTHGERSTAK